MKITAADLNALCPNARAAIVDGLVAAMPAVLAGYGITTGLRFCHFIAQAAHETAGLTTLNEFGNAAYFEKHYGPGTTVGKRLGNTEKGDGARFHGRGIFQLTGRANYRVFGQKIGADLVNNPGGAADPAISLKVACEYWKARGLNALADNDDLVEITRRINGGSNGLAARRRYLATAKTLWLGHDGRVTKPAAAKLVEEIPDAPIAMEPAPSAAASPTIIGAATAVASSGALGFLSYIESPYALAAFALIVVAAGVIAWRWVDHRNKTGLAA